MAAQREEEDRIRKVIKQKLAFRCQNGGYVDDRDMARRILDCDQVQIGACGIGDASKVVSEDGRPQRQVHWHADGGPGDRQVSLRTALDRHDPTNAPQRELPGSLRRAREEVEQQDEERRLQDQREQDRVLAEAKEERALLKLQRQKQREIKQVKREIKQEVGTATVKDIDIISLGTRMKF